MAGIMYIAIAMYNVKWHRHTASEVLHAWSTHSSSSAHSRLSPSKLTDCHSYSRTHCNPLTGLRSDRPTLQRVGVTGLQGDHCYN